MIDAVSRRSARDRRDLGVTETGGGHGWERPMMADVIDTRLLRTPSTAAAEGVRRQQAAQVSGPTPFVRS